jgi:hypothetical protein
MGFNATECCADVALCGDQSSVFAKKDLTIQSLIKPAASVESVRAAPRDSSLQCSACKAIANLAHLGAELAGLSGSQLDNYVAGLCNAVPTEYQSECDSVIQVGGLKVAQCVANSTTFSAQACCSEVSLCAAPSDAHMNALLGLQ